MAKEKASKRTTSCAEGQGENSMIWDTTSIQEANDRSGFQKINGLINETIYVFGILAIIATVLQLLIFKVSGYLPDHISIPAFLHDYIISPICAINIALLLVLTRGHDYYYNATKTVLLLSDYPSLQRLDFSLKVYLLFSFFMQCVYIESFVGLCTFAYIFTFVRAFYLHKHLDKDHPLWKRVDEAWFKNNKRHVATMIIWCLSYYLLLKMNLAYRIVCFLMNIEIDFADPNIDVAFFAVRLTFLVVFDFYWIHRVLHKVTIQRNMNFHAKNERLFENEVNEYYAKKNHS